MQQDDFGHVEDKSTGNEFEITNSPTNIQSVGETLARDEETETVFRGTAGGAAIGALFGPGGVAAGAALGWLVGKAAADN